MRVTVESDGETVVEQEPFYWWVDDRLFVPHWNHDVQNKLRLIEPLLRELGLTPHRQRVPGPDDSLAVRRTWGHARASDDAIVAIVRENPGLTIAALVPLIYRTKGAPWTPGDQGAGKNKLSVAFVRLVRLGRIVRSYDADGRTLHTAQVKTLKTVGR